MRGSVRPDHRQHAVTTVGVHLGHIVPSMLRILLIILLLLHGLIHFMGLARAFGAQLDGFSDRVPRMQGLLWGMVGLFFMLAAIGVLRHGDRWWSWALPAVMLSQVLIVLHWQDARFGTLANVLVLLAVILGVAVAQFRREYRDAARIAEQAALERPAEVVQAHHLQHLPPPVQRHVQASGVVGRPRPRVLRMVMHGELRSQDGDWFPFSSEQLNSLEAPERHYWLDATYMGLPTKGYHAFQEGAATMRIKALGLIPVVNEQGPEMDISDAVTWLNDLCLFAPGALLDPRFSWEELDAQRARLTFTHEELQLTAELVFDAEHRLADFISDQRYCRMPDDRLERHRFSTPAAGHRVMDGVRVPGYGEGVWHLPDGPFAYGRFHVRHIAYDR